MKFRIYALVLLAHAIFAPVSTSVAQVSFTLDKVQDTAKSNSQIALSFDEVQDNTAKFNSDAELYTVQFAGGTIGEFIELLETAAYTKENVPQTPEFVLHENSRHLQLPKISATTNLAGIALFIENYAGVSVESTDDQRLCVISENLSHFNVSAFNIQTLVDKGKQQELLAALKFGLNMRGGVTSFKIHKESGLLFFKGTGSDKELAANIVDEMTEGVMTAKTEAQPID